MLESTKTGLVMELRWCDVSWDMIAAALNTRRQRVHENYQPLYAPDSGPPGCWGRVVLELDAARRVAFARLRAGRTGRVNRSCQEADD